MNLNLFRRYWRTGTLTLVTPDGTSHSFGSGLPRCTWRLHERPTLGRIVRNPALNLGQTYTNGEWDVVEGSLHDLLTLLRTNLERRFASAGLLRIARVLLQSWNSVAASYQNVSHHYDLDEALFRACLDSEMHYSCAYFREPGMTLEAAQLAKCDHIANKLCLRPGLEVLDIGSGWGSLAMHLAQHHDVRVTGLTLSREQLRAARARAAERGLGDRVRFELQDYRQHRGTYDRIVSVGMFEHVGRRSYPQFFRIVNDLLPDNGVALLHTIAGSGPPEPVNPWIRRHIFPGGYIPALSDIASAVQKAGLVTSDVEVLRRHYAATLAEWARRFAAARDAFAASKGERFCRMWEFYLTVSQTGFEVGDLVVHHWQLAKHNLAVPITRDYLHQPPPAARALPPRASNARGKLKRAK